MCNMHKFLPFPIEERAWNFAIRKKKLQAELNLQKKYIMHDFLYSLSRIKEPTWSLPSTIMNLSLTDLPKDTTPPLILQWFKELIDKYYKGRNHIYTDGSKIEMGIGAAATTGNYTTSPSLTRVCSIFTTETHVMHLAIKSARTNSRRKFAISTDSRSCFQALQEWIPTNPKVRCNEWSV